VLGAWAVGYGLQGQQYGSRPPGLIAEDRWHAAGGVLVGDAPACGGPIEPHMRTYSSSWQASWQFE
jgi:hypothetical protein